MNHTPGPWKAVWFSEGEFPIDRIIIVGPKGLPTDEVCSITVLTINESEIGLHKANAHLLAAAPMLYDACKSGIIALNDACMATFSASSLEKAIERLKMIAGKLSDSMDRMEKALAQAEGK